jgi:hypothetical protein
MTQNGLIYWGIDRERIESLVSKRGGVPPSPDPYSSAT